MEFIDNATGSTLSFDTAENLKAKVTKSNDNLNALKSEVVNSFGNRFEDIVKSNEFYSNLDTDEKKLDFLSEARGAYDENVVNFLQTLPANLPQAEVDVELRKALPKIVKETRDEVLEPLKQKQMSQQAFTGSQVQNPRGTGANDPAVKVVKDSLFSKMNPWYSARNPFSFLIKRKEEPDEQQKLFSRLDRVEQLSNRINVASSNATQVSGFRQEAEKRELNELRGWLNEKGRTYIQTLGGFVRTGGVPTDFGFQRFSPEQKETYQTQYLEAKKRFGFNLMEIAQGRTAEGIEFDPATLSVDDTLFFPNKQVLEKSYSEYQSATQSGQPRTGELLYLDVLSQLYNLTSEEQIKSFMKNQLLKAKQVFGE